MSADVRGRLTVRQRSKTKRTGEPSWWRAEEDLAEVSGLPGVWPVKLFSTSQLQPKAYSRGVSSAVGRKMIVASDLLQWPCPPMSYEVQPRLSVLCTID